MILQTIERPKRGKTEAVFDDGSRVATTEGAITAMFLYDGKAVSCEQYAAFKELSTRFLCRDYALEAISRRRMSEKELRDKLKQKGWCDDAAAYAVAWLSERGYLNDEDYAGAVARHYGSKGYGKSRVLSELYRRGVHKEYWEEATDSMPDTAETLDSIISRKLKNPEDPDEVRKLSAALYRRGFGWDDIRSALRRRGTDEPEEY